MFYFAINYVPRGSKRRVFCLKSGIHIYSAFNLQGFPRFLEGLLCSSFCFYAFWQAGFLHSLTFPNLCGLVSLGWAIMVLVKASRFVW